MQAEEIVGGPSEIGGLAAPRLQEAAAVFEGCAPPESIDALRLASLKRRQEMGER